MEIKENLLKVLDSISQCEKASGRKSGCVKLCAVSKFHPIEEIRQTLENRQFLYGENRVQEACEKFSVLKSENKEIKLHLIGQLQSNKVRNIVPLADCIQSVDRFDLLKEIEKQCCKIDKVMNILFEYHTGEDSKSGFTDKSQIIQALDVIALNTFPHIKPCGFMTMAPFTSDETLIRKSFQTLRTLKEEMQNQYPQFNLSELSMGMSGDYKIAIEEGSTMVRIGTAIFGERDYSKK